MNNASIIFLEKYFGIVLCAFFTALKKIRKLTFPPGGADLPVKKVVFVKFIEQGAFVLHRNTFVEATNKLGAENVFICTLSANVELINILKVVPPGNIIAINEKSVLHFAIGFIKALLEIRKRKVDSAIDLEFFSRATAIFTYLAGASKRTGYHRFLGSQNYRGDLLTHRLNYSHYVHLSESSWSLLKSLDVPVRQLPALDAGTLIQHPPLIYTPDETDKKRLSVLLGFDINSAPPIMVINLSLNDVLPLRKWPEKNYHDFIMQFNNQFPNYTLVFTGRADEQHTTENFLKKLPSIKAINLCGKTQLKDILTLYTFSRLLLTSDSGPAHFASLTTINSIVLFGPETPVLYSPKSEKTKILYHPLPCSPCYNVYNNRFSACKNNLCLQKISVAEVLNSAKEIIS